MAAEATDDSLQRKTYPRKHASLCMPRVESSILINATPEAVWELISDIERLPEWAPDIKRTGYVEEGEIGAGTSCGCRILISRHIND